MSKRGWILIGSALPVLALFALLAWASAQSRGNSGGFGVNAEFGEVEASSNQAADFSLELMTGGTVTLSELRGNVVMVDFWSSWCPFCIAEMPDFQKVSQAAGDRVEFIGVNLQDDAGLADDLRIETGITYRVTRDPRGVVYAAFGGIAMPTTVFIDANGIVREVVTGQMSEDRLTAKIAEHFSIGV